MRLVGLFAFAMIVCSSASAFAQLDDDLIPATQNYLSAERFIVEFHGGPYEPGSDDTSINGVLNDDAGPLLSMNIEYILLRVPDVLYGSIGGGIGWMKFTGNARDASGGVVSEETDLSVIPLQAIAALRIDALPRKLQIPFSFGAKLGWEWAFWSTGTGERTDARGWSLGLLYGAQVLLDLDTFEPAAARAMDEEWGINHSFLFFEFMKFSPTDKSLPIGDTYWSVGLGFVF